MSNNISDIVNHTKSLQFATSCGTNTHNKLQQITIDGDRITGDKLLAQSIISAGLESFFTKDAKCEVPVAGTLNGKFISRRIDRMIIDPATKTIRIIDYKTDTDKTARREKYIKQLHEYCDLMQQIYPDFAISATILWTHDWTPETI